MAIGRVNTGGGGSGATLVITGVAGDTCTITKDGKSKTKTFGSDGKATFKGLETGTWTVTMTNSSGSTATRTVTINADYTLAISYFSATIAVTYPAGSTCTCTDGNTTLTAVGTTGSYTFTVPNSGTWTVSCTNGTETASKSVSITADGQSESVTLAYELVLVGGGTTHEDVTGKWKSETDKYTIASTAQQLKITGASGGLTGRVYADGFTPSALQDYSTVVMTYSLQTSYSVTQKDFRLEIASAKTGGTIYATTGSLEWTDKAKTVSVDVSNVKSGYIRFLCGQTTDPGFIITSLKLTH